MLPRLFFLPRASPRLVTIIFRRCCSFLPGGSYTKTIPLLELPVVLPFGETTIFFSLYSDRLPQKRIPFLPDRPMPPSGNKATRLLFSVLGPVAKAANFFLHVWVAFVPLPPPDGGPSVPGVADPGEKKYFFLPPPSSSCGCTGFFPSRLSRRARHLCYKSRGLDFFQEAKGKLPFSQFSPFPSPPHLPPLP